MEEEQLKNIEFDIISAFRGFGVLV